MFSFTDGPPKKKFKTNYYTWEGKLGPTNVDVKSLKCVCKKHVSILERDSLTVSALACHPADLGSNPAQGHYFFN